MTFEDVKVDTMTEDEAAFGVCTFVYCNQHCKPHLTGWCSVSNNDKVGLGTKDAKKAYQKCIDWNFVIYDGNKVR